jgi:hypothetical protein
MLDFFGNAWNHSGPQLKRGPRRRHNCISGASDPVVSIPFCEARHDDGRNALWAVSDFDPARHSLRGVSGALCRHRTVAPPLSQMKLPLRYLNFHFGMDYLIDYLFVPTAASHKDGIVYLSITVRMKYAALRAGGLT